MLPWKPEAFPKTLEGTGHTWGRECAATRTPTGDPREVARATATSPKVMPNERSCSSDRGNIELFLPSDDSNTAPQSAAPRGERHRAPVLPGAEPAASTRPETVSRGLVSMSACVLVPVLGPGPLGVGSGLLAPSEAAGPVAAHLNGGRGRGNAAASVNAHRRDSLDNVHK